MNLLDKQVDKIDSFQRNHKAWAFTYAVIKKYGDDRSAYNGALITYYGFLSLFPLLIVLTSVLRLITGNGLHAKLINSINNYFPVLGHDLTNNIHTLHRNSIIGIIVGLLGMLYGARGVADILRYTVDQTWHVPLHERPGFPKNLLNSLSIIGAAGAGVILSIVATSYAAGLGHSWWARGLTGLLGLIILIFTLYWVFKLALSIKIPRRILMLCAAITSAGVLILETLGGYILSHELKHFSTLYGTFAIVLGLFFWIYLLAQLMLYALQIGVVKQRRLWPRGINSKNPTKADEHLKPLTHI